MPSRPRDRSFNYFYEEGVELIFGLVGSIFPRSIFASIFTLCVSLRCSELRRASLRVAPDAHARRVESTYSSDPTGERTCYESEQY
jgi:hypothetical protein